ncbi:MAG TPA: two-component regulator propeller domain-containing protein [Cyclobacteriaceae bacterium]
MKFLFAKKTFKLITAVVLQLLLSNVLIAQPDNLELESFTTNNGLSQNEVFCIVQDKKGFIWLGTDEGLNRFDGYEFKVYSHSAANKNTLADNSIHALALDDDGTLWIGTANGLCRYYPETEFIERLEVDYTDPRKPNGTGVNKIFKDPKGNMWICYLGSGVDVYSKEKKEFHQYSFNGKNENHILNDYISALQFMPDGYTLLATRQGIQVLNEKRNAIDHIEALKKYPWLDEIDNSMTCFQLCSNGKTLLIGTELHGFYKINLETNGIKNFNTANSNLKFNNNVPSIREDSKGQLWIGGEAIYLFNATTEKLTPYNELGRRNEVTLKNPILSIVEDHDHNIWFGTYRVGVLKYNPSNFQIMHFPSMQNETARHDQVLSFMEDSGGNIWVGTDGSGLYKLQKNFEGFDKAPNSEAFSSQVIKCIYQDREGVFWMGTWDGGMIKYNPNTKVVKIFNPELKNFDSRHVWDIIADSLDNLWIGTLRDGLCYFSPKTSSYIYYKNIPSDTTSLVNNDILSLLFDSQKNLWIATSNGVSIIKAGTTTFKNLQPVKYPDLNLNVLCFYEDEQNKMWLGTNGGGIIVVDKNLNVIKTVTEKDGLPSSTICAMKKDKEGNLWISTYKGIVRMDHNNKNLTVIPKVGLQGNEFIPKSSYYTREGQLLFGGVHGFNLFKPDSLNLTRPTHEIVFTSFKILNSEINPDVLYNDREILKKSITETSEIKLSYSDYAFTVSFSPLLYTDQESVRFSYMLENFDKDWLYTSSDKHFIHYTNLSPGKYTLRIKSSFDGIHWSASAKELKIIVTPPWWGTISFRLFTVAAFILFLLLLYRLRVRFLFKQKLKLEDLVHTRTNELEKSNFEIQVLLKEVDLQKKDIENKNHELQHINEELLAQYDSLESKSEELYKAQEKLQDINSNLEKLIDERTQKLNETLLELETFLYRASHDLRGPISSMLGLVKVAEMEPVSELGKKYLEFQEKSIIRLERTLQKLTQKYNILQTKVSNEIITRQTIQNLLSQISLDMSSYREEDLDINITPDLNFETDRNMLRIILTNLLDNAFFFTDKAADKRVLLDVRKNHSAIIISVSDQGPGIRSDVKGKIFTMFYRGHELSTGNGLGLYLVKSALEKIHGKIEVETEEGKYSRFIVKLPLDA